MSENSKYGVYEITVRFKWDGRLVHISELQAKITRNVLSGTDYGATTYAKIPQKNNMEIKSNNLTSDIEPYNFKCHLIIYHSVSLSYYVKCTSKQTST